MYCPECGHHNREGARFCGRCGASLLEADTVGEATEAFSAAIETRPRSRGRAGRRARRWSSGVGGGRSGEQFVIDRELITIGRAPQSDMFLDDITVSREHARVERTANGLVPDRRRQPQRHIREPAADRVGAARRTATSCRSASTG